MKSLALILAAAALTACTDPQPAVGTPASTESPATDNASFVEVEAEGTDAEVEPSYPVTPDATDAAPLEADYRGRWTGVEGMYLDVASKPEGGVTLDMQWDLDHHGMFDGTVTAEGLRFVRDGVAESAVRTNGDATGLKYLAGKQDCLTVKPGEGYCRD